MTKIRCKACGEKHDSIHIISECTNCYARGGEKEQEKERKRIVGLINEYLEATEQIVEPEKDKRVFTLSDMIDLRLRLLQELKQKIKEG